MIIEVNNLSKVYGKIEVLNIENLKIESGESFGLVGNNGAGKTTFFQSDPRFNRSVWWRDPFNGIAVARSDHWKAYTGSYIDEKFLIEFLYPEEYFEFVANLNSLTRKEYTDFIEKYREFFAEEILGQKKFIRDLSKGNQKKVGIAAALLTKSDLLVMDEPFPHLDPTSVFQIKEDFA